MKIKELLLRDRSVTEFCRTFENELAEIIILLEEAESVFESVFSPNKKQRHDYVQEYTFMALESAITSVRLLIEGHINASGNTMRICYESVSMGILLCEKNPITHRKGKNKIDFNFYEAYKKKDNSTQSHHAVEHVIANAEHLGLIEGKEWLKQAKDFYNRYSHVTLISIGSLALSSGKAVVGGGFHNEKKELYANHIDFIARFIRQLPELIQIIGLRNQIAS